MKGTSVTSMHSTIILFNAKHLSHLLNMSVNTYNATSKQIDQITQVV